MIACRARAATFEEQIDIWLSGGCVSSRQYKRFGEDRCEKESANRTFDGLVVRSHHGPHPPDEEAAEQNEDVEGDFNVR